MQYTMYYIQAVGLSPPSCAKIYIRKYIPPHIKGPTPEVHCILCKLHTEVEVNMRISTTR